MAAQIFIGYDAAAPALADAMTTTFHGVFDATTRVAHQLTSHARAFTPAGMPGVVHMPYKFLLVILGAVARVDGSAIVGALNPLRGTFMDTWVEAAFQRLEAMGAFTPAYPSLEALIENILALTAALAIYPAEFILTAADYLQNLSWFPGHFGALPNQPWSCGIRFDQHASGPHASLRALFMFAFECAPYYVRSQVTGAGGSFTLMSQSYFTRMEEYSSLGVGTGLMSVALALSTFPGFAVAIALPSEMWVLPTELSDLLRLLGQRCALLHSGTGAGSSTAAEDALLRQHFLLLKWRFPLA